MILRTIFGPKMKEVTGGWRKLHNEELHNLHTSSSIIRIIKSGRISGAGHVARVAEKTKTRRKETIRKNLDVGGKIILKLILEK
jgi:hypothetical protein